MTARRFLDLLPAIYRRPDPTAPGGEAFLEGYLEILETVLGDRAAPDTQAGMAALVAALPGMMGPRLSAIFPGDERALPPVLARPYGVPNQRLTDDTLRRLDTLVGVVPLTETAEPGPWTDTVLDWLSGYLEWLAGWLDFEPARAWEVDRKRAAILAMMPLYRRRGTREGLEGMLRLFFGDAVTVRDLVEAPMPRLGDDTVLGTGYHQGDPVLDGYRPYACEVVLEVPTYDLRNPAVQDLVGQVQRLVDRERPAHAACRIRLRTQTLTVGTAAVGVTTLIPDPEKSP